jgi:beta-galactosidase
MEITTRLSADQCECKCYTETQRHRVGRRAGESAAIVPLRLCVSAFILFCVAAATPDDFKTHTLALRDGKFNIDGQPIELICGEMHPARIPCEFWEDRIQKAKAMGLNAISLYFFWNQLEPTEGHFDFTGDNDVRRCVQLCQKYGLWVMLRPGPYVCAETEFGGYPAWLLKHHDIRVRTDDPQFMNYCRLYMKALHDQLGDLQVTHGGPILMIQIENELSSINKYLADLKQMFVDVGFDTQLYTCDHSGGVWNTIQGLPNILRGVNGLPNEMKFEQSTRVSQAQGYPVYSPEVYTAWFSVWGGPLNDGRTVSIARQLQDTQWLLTRHLSFCFYLFDGGTNFGFSNGAKGYQPVQTTYDYSAPVDELGRVTPKYRALRDLLTKTFNLNLPPIPPDPKVIQIPPFELHESQRLIDLMSKPTASAEDVLSMEDLDQSYGLIDYHKQMPAGIKGKLNLRNARDYAIIMLDGKVVGRTCQGMAHANFDVELNHPDPCNLDILVYNLGRNSVGIIQAISRKGMTADPTLDGVPLKGWDMYSLPMDDVTAIPDSMPAASDADPTPAIYSGTFTLSETGETYLDMRNWHFGAAWVNGHNLGRFWDIGAARCLYLPSVWQKVGENKIVVMELGDPPAKPEIQGVTNLVIEPPKAFYPSQNLH